jgi:hypothetical protein
MIEDVFEDVIEDAIVSGVIVSGEIVSGEIGGVIGGEIGGEIAALLLGSPTQPPLPPVSDFSSFWALGSTMSVIFCSQDCTMGIL